MNRATVVGASADGVPALIQLAAALPAHRPAAVLVVLHVGAHPSVLPRLLSANAALPVAHAEHHQPVRAGQMLVAPSDRPLLMMGHRTHLSRGPKEHFSRPTIGPLFRSAALHFGARAVEALTLGTDHPMNPLTRSPPRRPSPAPGAAARCGGCAMRNRNATAASRATRTPREPARTTWRWPARTRAGTPCARCSTMFLQHEAGQRRASGNAAGAARLVDAARRLAEHVEALRRMLEDGPSALAA